MLRYYVLPDYAIFPRLILYGTRYCYVLEYTVHRQGNPLSAMKNVRRLSRIERKETEEGKRGKMNLVTSNNADVRG